MVPVRRLLIGLDLSADSDALVDCLPALRTWGVEEVILTHVVRQSPVPLLHRNDPTGGVAAKLAAAEAMLGSYFQVRYAIAAGDPAQALAGEALAREVDGIVLAMRDRSAVSDAVFGDTGPALARQTGLPILLYPHRALAERRERPVLRPATVRILHPTDFSPEGEGALRLAGALGISRQLPVSLLHVVRDRESEKSADERLRAMADSLRSSGVPEAAVKVRIGTPWEEILAESAVSPSPLVILGMRGHGHLSSLFLGSQSHEVARRSALPLLLVPGAYRP
jgi:nucleotide-binding universal stress UspA family protein